MSLQSRLSALITAIGADVKAIQTDSRWTNARAPTGHHATHEPGGSDAMAVNAAAATASLRSLGTGSTNAAPGNDARFNKLIAPSIKCRGGLAYGVAAGWNTVLLDTLTADTLGLSSGSGFLIPAGQAGWYEIRGAAYFQNSTGAVLDAIVGIITQGVNWYICNRQSVASGYYGSLPFSINLSMAVGDSVGLALYASSVAGSGVNVQPALLGTFLSMTKMT